MFKNRNQPYKQLRPITLFLENAIYSIICCKFKNYCKSEMLLDAFAGTGRFGLFIHNKLGIKNTVFLEKNNKSCIGIFKKIQFNTNLKVVCANFFSFIYNKQFDIIILDPPFKYKLTNKLLRFITKQTYLTTNTLVIMRKSISDVVNYNEHSNISVLYEYKHGYNQCLFLKVNEFNI